MPDEDEAARRAGVPLDSPEYERFSRWAFLVARQAGAVDLIGDAKAAFRVARAAAGHRSNRRDFRGYAMLAQLFGWSLMGKLACFSDRFRPHH